MKKNIKKCIVAAMTAALTLVGTAAFAQMDDNYRPYQSWDADNNDKLIPSEYFAGITETNVFQTWDDNDDGFLNKDELGSGIYKKWERSGENFKERADARARVWARYYAGNFNDWDLDGNGTVTTAEFNNKTGREKQFKMHDKMDANKDGKVDEKEFYGTLFEMWDDDSSGYLSMKEYDPDEFESWFL